MVSTAGYRQRNDLEIATGPLNPCLKRIEVPKQTGLRSNRRWSRQCYALTEGAQALCGNGRLTIGPIASLSSIHSVDNSAAAPPEAMAEGQGSGKIWREAWARRSPGR
jgi:hypothetical protein